VQRNLSAEKDARQNEKRRVRNRMVRSRSKTLVKDFMDAVEAKKKPEAEKLFTELSSFFDNAVTKGIFHRNTAARKKSRMNLLLNKMGS
jgi:small subunit ribosomal protein S20